MHIQRVYNNHHFGYIFVELYSWRCSSGAFVDCLNLQLTKRLIFLHCTPIRATITSTSWIEKSWLNVCPCWHFLKPEWYAANKVQHRPAFFALADLTRPKTPVEDDQYQNGGYQLSASCSVRVHSLLLSDDKMVLKSLWGT